MSRAPHSRWHDAAVLATAATTVLAIWATYHLTEPTTSAPDTSPSARAETHTTTLLSGQPSRGGARTTPPLPRGVGALNVRGRSEPNGERKPRPVVGLTPALRCIRHLESRGDYHITNPSSGASGAFQFLDSTWEAVSGLPAPAAAYSRAVQNEAALKLWDNGAGASHWVTAGGCT